MASSRVIEPVSAFEDRHLCLPAGVPCVPPDQLGFDGFEERFNSGLIIAISLAAHRHFEALLAPDHFRTPWPFWNSPLCLENTVLTPKPLILLGEAQILFRHHICVSVRRDPLVQRRHPETQIISHLFARQPARQLHLGEIRPSVSVP